MRLAPLLLFQPEVNSLFAPAAGVDPKLDRGRERLLVDEVVDHGSTKADDFLDLFEAQKAIWDGKGRRGSGG